MAKVQNVPPALNLEAGSRGAADQNESTPLEQRDPVGTSPETQGPDIDPETGHYRPATYAVQSAVPKRDGTTEIHTIIRRDR